jgi:hypothetical protein
VAKDLTKTASKSAIKITAGEAKHCGPVVQMGGLVYRQQKRHEGHWFFLGGVLLDALGFRARAVGHGGLAAVLVLLGVTLFVPPLMGKSKASKSAKELFAKNQGINLLAAASVVLFGARDVWFVVGVPVFLYCGPAGHFPMVGGFLAAWTIGYGAVQAFAPQLVRRSTDGLSSEVPAARLWSALLAVLSPLRWRWRWPCRYRTWSGLWSAAWACLALPLR